MSTLRALWLAWGAVVALLAYPAASQTIGEQSGIMGGDSGFLRPVGGGGEVILWTPAELGASLALWLDADDAATITLNGSNVVQWDDKSGNGRNASQGTAANQPGYVTNVYNGKPTVRSDGSNDFLSITPFSVSAGIRAYGVINPRNPPAVRRNGDWLWMTNFSTSSPHFGGHDGNTARNWFSSFFSTSRPQITATNIPADTLYLSYIEQTGTALNGIVFGLIPESTAAAAFNGSPTTVFQLFSTFANTEAAFDISEIVFAQSPTVNEQQRIEGYLAWKWGLSYALPNDHPYKWDTSLFGGTDLSGFDADAKTYITSVETADKQDLETGVRTAVNDFVVGCKADGIWAAIKASAILAGARTLTGALTPLVGTAPTNFNFVSGDYNRKTGLLGNGITKRLDSNRAGNADPQNSKHLAMFIGETGIKTSFSNTMCDGVNGGEVVSMLAITPGASQIATRLNTFTGTASNLYSGVGFYGVSRNNSATYLVRGSATSNTVTMASQTPNTANTGVFMRTKDAGAGPTQFFDGRLSFYSIGEAIDLALLDTRVSALMTAIDGAIP